MRKSTQKTAGPSLRSTLEISFLWGERTKDNWSRNDGRGAQDEATSSNQSLEG
jgi:hypothetical protein